MRLRLSLTSRSSRLWALFYALSAASIVAASSAFAGIIFSLLSAGNFPSLAKYDLVTVRAQAGPERLRFGYPDLVRLRDIPEAGPAVAWGPGEAFVETPQFAARTGFCFASEQFMRALSDTGRGMAPLGQTALVTRPFWDEAFGGDFQPQAAAMRANGIVISVAGILPSGFDAGALGCSRGLFIPLELQPALDPSHRVDRGSNSSTEWIFIGIERPSGLGRAATEQQLTAQWLVDLPRTDNEPKSVQLRNISYLGLSLLQRQRIRVLLIGVAVAALCVLGIVNLLLLSLSYVSSHAGEIATRRALGAGAAQLYRWALARLFQPAFFGMAVGWFGSLSLGKLLQLAMGQSDPPNLVVPRWPVVLIAVMIIGVVGVVSASITWRAASLISLDRLLRQGADTILGRSASSRMQAILATTQLACCFLLLAATGAINITVRSLASIDLGFEPRNLLIYELSKTGPLSKSTPELLLLEQNLNESSQIRCASIINPSPFSGEANFSTIRPLPDLHGRFMNAQVINGGPHVLCALGASLVSGNGFESGKGALAIVTQSLAKRVWPGQLALGKSFRFGHPARIYTVAGVIRDLKTDNIREAESPIVILPYDSTAPDASLLVRSSTSSASTPVAISSLVRGFGIAHPELMLDSATGRLQNLLTRPAALVQTLLAVFSAFALIYGLAAVYGVVALAVSSRRAEIGLRLALGGSLINVFWAVSQGLRRLVIAGIASGAALAFVAGQVFGGVLLGNSAAFVVNYITVGLLVAGASALAGGPLLISAVRRNPVALLKSL